MKKVLTLILVLILSFSTFATFNCGFGLGLAGDNDGNVAIDLNGAYRPFEFKALNPFVRVETGLAYKDAFKLDDVNACIGFELIRVPNKLFSFVQVNKGLYSPSLSFGVSYGEQSLFYTAELSLLRFLDTDFIYEWLSVTASTGNFSELNFRVNILRFTKML